MRSKQKKTQHCCICCGRRLWPLGGSKQYLGRREELAGHSNLSDGNTDSLSSKGTPIDDTLWVEELLCGEHGKMWLLVKQGGETIVREPLETTTRIRKLEHSAD